MKKLPDALQMRITRKLHSRMVDILNETYVYYAQDPSRRGKSGDCNNCVYLAPKTGAMCAVGRCMVHPTVGMNGSADEFFLEEDSRKQSDVDVQLKSRYRGLPVQFWTKLQNFHDKDYLWGDLEKGDPRPAHEAYVNLHQQIVGGYMEMTVEEQW